MLVLRKILWSLNLRDFPSLYRTVVQEVLLFIFCYKFYLNLALSLCKDQQETKFSPKSKIRTRLTLAP